MERGWLTRVLLSEVPGGQSTGRLVRDEETFHPPNPRHKGHPTGNPFPSWVLLCFNMLGEGGDLDSTNSTLIMKTWVGLAQGSSNPAWVPAFLPKRPRPKEPFAFGGGLEGKEGRGREQAGVCKPAARRGELGAPALGRRVCAGDAVALSGPESGDAPSPPLTPPAPPGSAPESLRPGGSDFRRRAGSGASPGQAEFGLRRR